MNIGKVGNERDCPRLLSLLKLSKAEPRRRVGCAVAIGLVKLIFLHFAATCDISLRFTAAIKALLLLCKRMGKDNSRDLSRENDKCHDVFHLHSSQPLHLPVLLNGISNATGCSSEPK